MQKLCILKFKLKTSSLRLNGAFFKALSYSEQRDYKDLEKYLKKIKEEVKV